MRILIVPVFLALSLGLAPPAHAQFGGLFGKPKNQLPDDAGPPKSPQDCSAKPKQNSIGRQFLGNMMGSLAGRATSQMGMVGSWIPTAEVAGVLSDAIACRLDPGEQKKAADATLAATRQDKVGATSSWKSESRPGVSGTSTVVARTSEAGGATCMTVSDVIIVEGEETTVNKRMCRVPPATGYTIAAA